MPKFYAIFVALMLIAFAYGQYRGYSLFGSDAQARSGSSSSGGGGGYARIYHK